MSRKRRTPSTKVQREFDPSRWSYVVLAVMTLIAAWLLSNLTEDIWALVWSYAPKVGRPVPVLANAIGVTLALLAGLIAGRRKEWVEFLNEVVVESSQITWPSRQETRAAVVVVVVMTAISSSLLAGMDTLWSSVTDWLYGV